MEKKLQYRSEIQEIPRIRKELKELSEEWGIPKSEHRQICVIIEELFSNIVRFAFSDHLEHRIDIRLNKTEKLITMEIIDDGIPFNPLEYDSDPVTDPAASDAGGMGLNLVRTFSETLEYLRMGNRNRLTITRTVKSRSN